MYSKIKHIQVVLVYNVGGNDQMTLFMAFLNALNWILQPILNLVAWLGSTGNWYYIFVAGFILWAIFRYGGRLRFYLFLAGAGVFVVLIGFALLCSLTPSGIHSVGDFFLFILLLIAFIAIIFLGGKIIRFFTGAAGRQRSYERRVDCFHDAWNSRNDRW